MCARSSVWIERQTPDLKVARSNRAGRTTQDRQPTALRQATIGRHACAAAVSLPSSLRGPPAAGRSNPVPTRPMRASAATTTPPLPPARIRMASVAAVARNGRIAGPKVLREGCSQCVRQPQRGNAAATHGGGAPPQHVRRRGGACPRPVVPAKPVPPVVIAQRVSPTGCHREAPGAPQAGRATNRSRGHRDDVGIAASAARWASGLLAMTATSMV